MNNKCCSDNTVLYTPSVVSLLFYLAVTKCTNEIKNCEIQEVTSENEFSCELCMWNILDDFLFDIILLCGQSRNQEVWMINKMEKQTNTFHTHMALE